jgi:hypothetical protein
MSQFIEDFQSIEDMQLEVERGEEIIRVDECLHSLKPAEVIS